MESEDDFDMQNAKESTEDDDFYSGSDADADDYEFIDNDSNDLASHRHDYLDFANKKTLELCKEEDGVGIN
ncbi:hypothetical protein QYF36_026523 [Acer negundo]|nr:hypothetical protein QYF36_026523 [Acer negundo]